MSTILYDGMKDYLDHRFMLGAAAPEGCFELAPSAAWRFYAYAQIAVWQQALILSPVTYIAELYVPLSQGFLEPSPPNSQFFIWKVAL